MGGLNKIVLHWTAGTYVPNKTDFEHYHYLVTGEGLVIEGKYKPEDNINCNDGKYAQHCGGGNTGAIGIALCGMAGYNGKYNSTKYPLTKVQCERAFKLSAELCKKYGIKISPDKVMTHYEFGKKHPTTSSSGKIDIIFLHPYNKSLAVGDDFIRNKIQWYFDKL